MLVDSQAQNWIQIEEKEKSQVSFAEDLDLDDFADVERFCHVEVEPVNVECDQVQIIARTCAEIELYGAFRLEYVRWSSTVSVRHPFEKNSTAKTSAHDVASTMTL